MSTLPGQASKGEKTKQKFQSLDINSLYRNSRGENLEKQQQKSSSIYIKHGMQSLGKVPNARRPPANLPSLKAEHSGSDAAIPLVPPGASGWGKQESTVVSNSQSSQQPGQQQQQSAANQAASVAHAPASIQSDAAATAQDVSPAAPSTKQPPTPSVQSAHADKLWSSVTGGGQEGSHQHPPLYHSPQFQHEFPSLSAGDGGPTRTGSDAPQYSSGLSLRPQTEGSWTQGGQRSAGGGGVAVDASGRPALGVPGSGGAQLSAQAGLQQQQPFPPQIRGVLPPFMYKGSSFQQGTSVTNQNLGPSVNGGGRNSRPLDNRPPRLTDRETDEVVPRPIIKEEELNRMDEIGKDMGWAESDDIDYNQKLAFSDDESDRNSKREPKRSHQHFHRDQERGDGSHPVVYTSSENRQWSSSRSSRGRSSEEDDVWVQRRSQSDKEMEIVVQRAKQRKEEEEKRFIEERKLAANKKLMELEEKIQRRDRDGQENTLGTINPASVPQKPIVQADIPLPDFQKDKEREQRSSTSNEEKNQNVGQENSFRHLTQIEGKNFQQQRKQQPQKPSDRDRDPRGEPSFSRHFQNDLPPRFLKHHQKQNPYQSQSFDGQRWKVQPLAGQPLHGIQQQTERETSEDDRREYKRQSSEESYRGGTLHHPQQQEFLSQKSSENHRYSEEENRRQSYEQQSYREKDEDKWNDKDRSDKEKKEVVRRLERSMEENFDSKNDWNPRRDKIKEEIGQKQTEQYADNRERSRRNESRSVRHSRDSELRDQYSGISWAESAYESPAYEGKRRESERTTDRRVVPGPITKDRIEADDLRNEKRSLTQLKRGGGGQPLDAKTEPKKEEKEESEKDCVPSAWADAIPLSLDNAENDRSRFGDWNKIQEAVKVSDGRKADRSEDYGRRNRHYGHAQCKGYDGHGRGSAWQKRPPSRGHKGLYHTDSDGSAEDRMDRKTEKNDSQEPKDLSREQKSSKPTKKAEKDDKNRDKAQEKFVGDQKKQEKSDSKRDQYIPRGEPSRHGRGGGGGSGSFRSARMGGLVKRIDGYGPPPSKSPFSHHEDKKHREDENASDSNGVSPATEDKTKQNQQALAAGIIGRNRSGPEPNQNLEDRSRFRNKPSDSRKTHVNNSRIKGKEEGNFCDTNSEHSDERDRKDSRKPQGKPQNSGRIDNRMQSTLRTGRNNLLRLGQLENKKSYDGMNSSRQNSYGSPKKDDKLPDQNILANAIVDISIKNREDDRQSERDDKNSLNGDTEGFQEVKSKKNVRERQKSVEDRQKNAVKLNEPIGKDPNAKVAKQEDRKSKSAQLTQQQIQNIPSLMATPINPPQVLPQSKGGGFERPRQSKLAPRFAKQKLQKAQQMQQQHGMCDASDLKHNIYNLKDATVSASSVTSCAWDKPLVGAQLRNADTNVLCVAIESVKNLEHAQNSLTAQASQESGQGSDKILLNDKNLLDGSTPPVNTIIFENTNFKSAPGARSLRNDKIRSKIEEGLENSVMGGGFNKIDILQVQGKPDSKDQIQLPLFGKEDSADMKLDFFGSDLQFAEDKSSKALCMSKSIHHAISSSNNTVDSLDIKIASVKKVWETSEQEHESENQIGFGSAPLDSNVFNQVKDAPDHDGHRHEGYSPSPSQSASATTNVCKVKPTQQVSGGGQAALSLVAASHQQHSGIVGPGLMGNPLSPPPMQPVLGANVGLGPQQYTTNQHIGYQAGLSGNTQFGISAIPSPPTVPVLYNPTQQLQAAAQTAGLYGAFQIDQSGVLGGQGRSQFSQFPNYHGLGQTASSPYSTQSVYLQTAPHPPQAAQAPPELYQNINNYRLSTTPFGQNQQLNNPTTVLISSTSNSLMSASVKPSSQQISAIGTKAGGVGQAYQQQTQQGQQVYMTYDPSLQANYLPPSAAGVMQRGPGPVQNNVVPAGLQHSSSYYSGSTGGQTGYFQQPGSSSIPPSAQLQQHQTAGGYGLQGSVFGTHSGSAHTNTGLQNYSSHFLTTPPIMQMAINTQQFRSGLPAAAYNSKGVVGDQSQVVGGPGGGRPQQLKSPGSQEVLSSVFNPGSRIPSPKSRQSCKHPQPQSSPTAQHKYLYQGVGQQNQNIQRYPPPIQRPVNFQQMQQNNSVNQKHRNQNSKTPNRQYYGGQNNSLSSQIDKPDDQKMADGVPLNGASPSSGKTIGLVPSSGVTSTSEKVKDSVKVEMSASLKD